MHMENQQQLPTILSKAINLKQQTNLNTTKTNLPTTRRIWIPRDEFEYEPDLNTTLWVWIPRDGFKYHETDLNTTKLISIPRDGLNTTRRIWIPRDRFEYHEMDLNTTRRICIPLDGFKYHEANLNTTRRVWIPRDEFNTTRRILDEYEIITEKVTERNLKQCNNRNYVPNLLLNIVVIKECW